MPLRGKLRNLELCDYIYHENKIKKTGDLKPFLLRDIKLYICTIRNSLVIDAVEAQQIDMASSAQIVGRPLMRYRVMPSQKPFTAT